MRRRLVSIGIVLGVIATFVPAYTSAHRRRRSRAPARRSAASRGASARTPRWSPSGLSAGCSACRSTTRDRPARRSSSRSLGCVHTSPDEDYQGIMLVNPGGPGGSGLIYSVLGAFVPGDVGSTYDWIGFDPRGVGDSVPALSCDPDYTAGPRPPYDPTTVRIEFAWLVKSAKYAIDCARNGGFLLGHLKTTDTVADMDAIRQSLGAEQINFYGFSYGTYLGQVYATLHPDLVRRMVLDSNVDPRTVWYQANLDQDPAFEITINKFFDWVALHDDAYHLGTTGADVSAKYYAALDSLAANPQGQLGASEWADAFLGAGYVQFLWPDTAAAFAAFVNNGDPGPATDLYLGQDTPGDDNGYAMYLATECTDARWPRNWLTWHRDNTRVARRRSVPHVGQRLVQRSVRVLVRAVRPAGERRRIGGARRSCSSTRRSTRPRRSRAASKCGSASRTSSLIATVGGTNHANSLFGGVAVRRRRRGRLPHRRHAAGAGRRQLSRRRVPAGP